jgi:hypothetical protein
VGLTIVIEEMNEEIRSIIIGYCDQIKQEANTESISKAVKSIDVIVQKMYLDLYGLKDIRYNKHPVVNDDKKGHCC